MVPGDLVLFAIIGFVVVLAAVIGGFLLEHGHLLVLYQPAEFVIIGGSAIGSMLIANPMRVLTGIGKAIPQALKGDLYDKAYYLNTLRMLYRLFTHARKNGDQGLEAEVENPEQGASFSEFPQFLKNHHAVSYVCDTLRVHLLGGAPHDLDALMEVDADTHHHDSAEPVTALQHTADALPGLGIVAAVLGVVVTMGSLGGPPEEIGHKVAAALVGTFLGILMCYGFVGPLATRIGKVHEAEAQYLLCLRSAVIAFVRGVTPLAAAEFGRRVIPARVRPSFQELEAACKGGSASAAAGGQN